MTHTGKVYHPDAARHKTYSELYRLYAQLHDGFGTQAWSGGMYNVMKDLLGIRDRVRNSRNRN